MKFSCIMPAFDEGALIQRSVGSVLAQSHADLQLIVIDDGASDATRRALACFDDPRLLVIRQANSGQSTARNKGLEHVAGDYVCFLDADDCRPYWAFERMAEVIERDAPDILVCPGTVSREDGALRSFYDRTCFEKLAQILGGAPVEPGSPKAKEALPYIQMTEPQPANKVIRTAFLRRHKLRFPDGHVFEDVLFHTMAIAHAQRISVLDTPCFSYVRQYSKPQVTSAHDHRRFDAAAVIKMTFELFQRTPAFDAPERRAAVTACCMNLAQWCDGMTSHVHREDFRRLLRVILETVDPSYLDIPYNIAPGVPSVVHGRAYMNKLGFGSLLSPARWQEFPKEERGQVERGLLQRLWPLRRA